MSKTAAFLDRNALRNLVSESIAIDMGSAATIVYVHGRGVVVDEPSLVAVNTITGEVVAIGLEAQQMYGREARDVTVIAPLLDGVVADFERTKEMLVHFVRKARGGNSYFSRRALMSVLFGITQVERRALLSAAEHARIGRVVMIEEGLAAAFGGGVGVDDPRASAVVDIGSRTTNVAIVANGAIVRAHAERIGSWDINAAIIDHVRRHRGLAIGAHSAERLKLELASAILPIDLAQEMTIKGRDVFTGSPGAIEITAGEVYPVAQHVVHKIVESVGTTSPGFLLKLLVIYMIAESSLRAAVRSSAAWTITCVNIPNYQCGSPMSPDMPLCVVSRRCSTNLFGYAASSVASLTLFWMRGLIITVSTRSLRREVRKGYPFHSRVPHPQSP